MLHVFGDRGNVNKEKVEGMEETQEAPGWGSDWVRL